VARHKPLEGQFIEHSGRNQAEAERGWHMAKVPRVIGSVILLALGVFIIVGAAQGPAIDLMLCGAALALFGVLGFVGLFAQSSKVGVFYVAAGIAAIIPAGLFCGGILVMGGEPYVLAAILLPTLIVTVLWIIAGLRQLKSSRMVSGIPTEHATPPVQVESDVHVSPPVAYAPPVPQVQKSFITNGSDTATVKTTGFLVWSIITTIFFFPLVLPILAWVQIAKARSATSPQLKRKHKKLCLIFNLITYGVMAGAGMIGLVVNVVAALIR
jgi:hypothetical protein